MAFSHHHRSAARAIVNRAPLRYCSSKIPIPSSMLSGRCLRDVDLHFDVGPATVISKFQPIRPASSMIT
jgi:hypothetical protein